MEFTCFGVFACGNRTVRQPPWCTEGQRCEHRPIACKPPLSARIFSAACGRESVARLQSHAVLQSLDVPLTLRVGEVILLRRG